MSRRRFILHRSYKIEVVAAHRCAECSDPKYDLISDGEGDVVQDVSTDKGCQDVGDGEHDVACTCNVRSEPVRDCLSEERVETNTERGQGDRHEECDKDDGDDLTVIVEQPGQENEEDEADTVEDRCPEDGAAGVTFGKPATSRDGEEEVDNCGHGTDETDL